MFPGLKTNEDDCFTFPKIESKLIPSETESNQSNESLMIDSPEDYHPNNVDTETHEVIDKASKEIIGDISDKNILNFDRRGNPIKSYVTEAHNQDKLTYNQVMNSNKKQQWNEAINKEISNIENHAVWRAVERKGDEKPLSCVWVFRVKKDEENKPVE